MHEKSVQTLEYPKVLAGVAGEAGFSVGKERVLALAPTPDLEEAAHRLAFTTEAVRLLDRQPWTGVGGAHDIRPQLVRAQREGALTTADLVAVAATLRAARSVERLLVDLDGERFPQMVELGARLPVQSHLIQRLEEIVNEDGEILDTASPRLRRLRVDGRAAEQRLQQRVRTLVGEYGDALQEPIVTMRGDRYVVPVKADFRGRVRGIVHDQSASGATLYIEPLAVVELNNQLREIQAQQQEEVERILREVSREIGQEGVAIEQAVDALAELDLQLAKARHARLHRCQPPRLNDQGRIMLQRARHPLLTGRVVPIDFHLGTAPTDGEGEGRGGAEGLFHMVVITGPNTGGKTVALKTVGLLTLMAQAGLHIPADDGSEIAVFEEVFADIGDEQSIEQSLSTFSSHMARIIDILRRIEVVRRSRGSGEPPPVLVLFDELGAGTDPGEGSALARSILTYLLDRQVPTVATTHYSELKAFAHEQAGVVNASVAFDIETLSPTYELEIGVPGRSNALAIAQRLGLDQRIIRGARRHLGTAGVRMEGLLQELEQVRTAAAGERDQLSQARAEAERQQAQLEEERRRVQEERARILDEARTQARRDLEEVQAEVARIRASARRDRITREHVDQLRTAARRLEEKVAPVPAPRRPRVSEEFERLEGPPQVGDTVRVLRLDQTGELRSLSADGREAEVQIGPMRMRVPAHGLERLHRREAAPRPAEPAILVPQGRSVPAQLDIRGWRVEDALMEVEGYLDSAALSQHPWVRIVHGKGTGALRTAVREHLARHPLVQSSSPGSPEEGGDGVTVVRLSA